MLARVGGAVVVGKDSQTRAPGDHTHPSDNVSEDDYRAVEIFPPSVKGEGDSAGHSKTFEYTWFEDDGIAAKPDIASFTVKYSATQTAINFSFEKGSPKDKYEPVWKNLHVILPVGDCRNVVCEAAKEVKMVEEKRGRNVWVVEF